METVQKIITVVVFALIIGSAAFNGYAYYKILQHEAVINTQGQALRLIIETPEINAVMVKELQRRQGLTDSATTTPKK